MKTLMATIAATAMCITALPAAAQDNASKIDHMSNGARSALGKIYRVAGTAACGKKCGKAAEKVGTTVFDVSKKATNHFGGKLQDIGKRARERANAGGQ